MPTVTGDYICDKSTELIEQIDRNIQTEEECRQVIKDAVSGGITYAKKVSECTDNRLVYVLRSGGKVIGEFVMEPKGETVHGYTPWAVTSDSFDLSFLISDTVSTTVPYDYPVYVNGNALDSDYITKTDIRFDELKEFYNNYSLPYMVTYEAGPCLGQIQLTVTDPDGGEVTVDENTDVNTFLDNCTDSEKEALDDFIDTYVRRYVTFTSNVNDDREGNYNRLVAYMVPGSTLADRMQQAIKGLKYAASKSDKIVSITIHHYVNIGDGKYMCDVTYLVDTTGHKGTVRTTNNIKVIITETAKGLKAESMTSY